MKCKNYQGCPMVLRFLAIEARSVSIVVACPACQHEHYVTFSTFICGELGGYATQCHACGSAFIVRGPRDDVH